MSLSKERLSLGVADYLEAEHDGAVRHEYVAGKVYEVGGVGASASTSARYNRIALNLTLRDIYRNVRFDGTGES